MTAPRTAVHPSGARRRPTAEGTRRRKTSATAVRRRSGARKPNRRRVAGRRKARPVRGRSLRDLRRLWPGLLIVVAVLSAVAWDTQAGKVPIATAECTLPDTSLTLTAEQVSNAATIAAVARDRGLPDRAVVIALATAQQESRLRNLDYGDRDSLGLFQQRPSQGWGTETQVQDPVYAAGKFYDGLVKVPGWDSGRLTDVAQAVQLSGFPEAYQQWEPMATELVAAMTEDPSHALSCG
jgi:hypothetical protein